MGIAEIIKESRNINWRCLHSCGNRPCDYLPDYFAGLCSDDQQQRNKAYWKFDNHVVVQAGLYDSAFYTIPFVIQLLKENMKHNRHNYEIYSLLFELGNGCGDDDEVEFSIVTEPFVYYIPKIGGIRWALTDACHDAVFSGWNIYCEEVMNQNSPNRQYALDLISSFYKNHTVMRNVVMQQLINSEPDSEIGKSAAYYIEEKLYPDEEDEPSPYGKHFYPEDFFKP